ncbi:voltage-gated potassium channel [Aureococcus anophagefferens]|nr:voltage-gated potassium channel [Aureococcus anophagefferens]
MASGVRVSQARTQEKERWERQATERARASTPDAHGGRGSRPNSATKRPGSATKRPATADDASSSSSKQSMVPRINHGEGRQEGDGRDQLCVSATPRAQLKIVHDHPDDPRTKKNTKANMLSRKESSWKRDLQVFLDDPNSTNAAMGFAVAMVILILVSAFILVFHESDCKGAIFGHWLGYFEVIACVIFSLEIVARFAVSQNVCKAIQDPYLIFDILAVLPCWLMPLRSCGQFLKMLKTLRMFRLLKLARRYEGSVVIVRAMKLSMPALTVAFFFLFTALTVFATFLYFTERLGKGERAAPSGPSPHTMWFMAVTMTTVGYGDVTPLTDGGRIVTVMAMLFGVLFISMPLAIVGNNFCLVWDDKERVIFVEKLKEQLALRGMGPSDMLATVEAMDADGSGMLSFREFLAALNLLEIKMSANRLAVLWRTLDTDHSGDVSLINFMEVIHRDDPAQLEILRSQFPSLQEPSAADGDDDAEEEARSPRRRRQSCPQTIAAEIRAPAAGPPQLSAGNARYSTRAGANRKSARRTSMSGTATAYDPRRNTRAPRRRDARPDAAAHVRAPPDAAAAALRAPRVVGRSAQQTALGKAQGDAMRELEGWWIGAEKAAREDLYWCDAVKAAPPREEQAAAGGLRSWRVCSCDDRAHRHFRGSAPIPALSWRDAAAAPPEAEPLGHYAAEECPICLCEPEGDAARMPCGHVACALCLSRAKAMSPRYVAPDEHQPTRTRSDSGSWRSRVASIFFS